MKSPDEQNSADPRVLRLSPEDNVGVAARTIEAGETIRLDGRCVEIGTRIATGHKLALVPIDAGAKVLKYGAPIGSATCDIRPGEYVHTHNVKSDYLPTYKRGDV